MRSFRIPALVAIGGLVAFALVVQRDDAANPDVAPTLAVAAAVNVGPRMAADSAASSTWFCDGGTGAGAAGSAELHVIVANLTDSARTARVTAFGSVDTSATAKNPVSRDVPLAAFGRVELALSDLTGVSAYVAAIVEIDGGGVLVEHSVTGPLGNDRAPCVTQAGTAWYLPVGATQTLQTPSAREIITIFNPFPDDAVVNLAFSTDNGQKEPGDYKSLVVPGRSVVGEDVTGKVPVAKEVSASVVATAGRVVVDRLQFYDSAERRGIALSSGSAGGATSWVVPIVARGAGRSDSIVVSNPSVAAVDGDLQLISDDDTEIIDPIPFTIAARGHRTINLADNGAAALLTAGGMALVRAAGDGKIVVEQQSIIARGSPGAGVTITPGLAVSGTRVAVDVVSTDPTGSIVAFVNPSGDRIARITRAWVVQDGQRHSVDSLVGVEIQPEHRLVQNVSKLGTGAFTVVLETTAPVVASRETITGADRTGGAGVPSANGAETVALAEFGLGGDSDTPGQS
jgi:hypothetical protein